MSYQSTKDALKRRRAIADAMMQQAQNGMGQTQVIGDRAIANSPMSGLINVLGGIQGRFANNQIDREDSDNEQQYNSQLAAALARGDINAITEASPETGTKFALAQALERQKIDTERAAAPHLSATGIVYDANGVPHNVGYGSDMSVKDLLEGTGFTAQPKNLGQNMAVNAQGQLGLMPGAVQALRDTEAAKEAGTQGEKIQMQTVTDDQGNIIENVPMRNKDFISSYGGQSYTNNFGNIKDENSPSGFASYATPEAGVQAMHDNLSAYKTKHGINTLEGLITRWSPPKENNTEKLIREASSRLGLPRDQPIDLGDENVRAPIINAIRYAENGKRSFGGQMPSFRMGSNPVQKAANIDAAKARAASNQAFADKERDKSIGAAEAEPILSSMEANYDRLNKTGDITNPDRTIPQNVLAWAKNTDIGQGIGGAVGADAQSIRAEIAGSIPLLTQKLMKSTGMTSQQVNSQFELDNLLKAVTNTKMDYKAVKAQIGVVRNLINGGKGKTVEDAAPGVSPAPARPAPSAELSAMRAKYGIK